jgi:cystathionine beta-lyase
MRVPEATYLAWLDCRALELPCPAGQFFLDQARVGLNFGEAFGADYAGFARLNFATPAAILRGQRVPLPCERAGEGGAH